MHEVTTSIYNEFSNDGALSGAVTDLYLIEAPEKTVHPYITFFIVSDIPFWTWTSEAREIVIQFNIFDDSPGGATIGDILNKLQSCYDWCTLTSLSGWTCIYMKRELNYLQRLEKEKVWQYISQYRLMISK